MVYCRCCGALVVASGGLAKALECYGNWCPFCASNPVNHATLAAIAPRKGAGAGLSAATIKAEEHTFTSAAPQY